MSRLRVLHCPTNVGANPARLARAERALGCESIVAVTGETYFGYDADVNLDLGASFFRNQWKIARFVAMQLPRCDVVHYNFGSYLFNTPKTPGGGRGLARRAFRAAYIDPVEGVDVRLAKALRKVVAVTFQGDDARQGDYCRENYSTHFAHEVETGYYTDDDATRRRIRFFDRHADLIYAVNPDLLNVLPARARFVPYVSVDHREWSPVDVETNAAPHIVHAPTHRTVKGTRYLVEALDRLRAEGVAFQLTLVEGMSNREARVVYEQADIVVDQLLAGYYGAFAVEVMALGKPVVAYMRESDLRHMPAQMVADLPIINADPGTIYQVLKEWLTVRRADLRERGARSRAYVERWHDPQRTAADMIADYKRVLAR